MLARYRSLILPAVLLAAVPTLLAAQGRRDRDDDDFQSRLDTTVTLSAGGVVDLALVSGEIKVSSWNRDQVRVSPTSEDGVLRFDATSGRVSLSVRSDHGHMGDTEYQITIPAGARLITRSVSGDITTSGGSDVDAHSTSGDLDISNVSGRATLESVSGEVKVRKVGAGLHVNSVSGDITASDVTGDVDAQSISGGIEFDGARSSLIRTQTVSGDTHYAGTIDRNGRYEFHSHSGDVELAIPATGVTFDIQTFSGDVQSDYPMTLQPGTEMGRKHMEFSINGGGARITAETFSGDVTIERAGGPSREN